MFEQANGVEILTAMITPAVLISASASLIFSTANRLGRIFDRVNLLKNEVESLLGGGSSFPSERAEHLKRQLGIQRRRADLIQRSMAALYTATALFVAASVALALIMALAPKFTWIAAGLALFGGGFLLIASLILLYESRYNLKFIRGQIDFIQFLETQSRAEGAARK
jgi:Protein of unknown function (DUF2721)